MVSMAQITDKLFAEVSFGLVEDTEHTDKDINLLSPDMSTSHSSDAELENGFDGWDYGSDSDRYAFMSVGLRMKLSK